MKREDSVLIRCPTCKAPAGERCKDYRGRFMQPHRSRVALVSAQAYSGRAKAARIKAMAENYGKQRSLWDDLPAPDLD